MDIKLNGNLYTQNDFMTKSKDMASGVDDKATRRAVLERNADAFKKVAGYAFDKENTYNSRGALEESKDVTVVNEELKKADITECIDTLKNLVTPEDYSELEAWGLIPDEDNPEAFVSVYERIQIELAAYCDDYNVPGLNVNPEKMKAVLGSEAMAHAVSMTKDLSNMVGELPDDTKKYLIANDIEPTLENVYKAVYSGQNLGGSAKSIIGDSEWQQLKPQVDKFFEINGIENNSGNIDDAKWIISNNIPLTVENFNKLQSLDEVDFSDEAFMDKLRENISYTLYFGESGFSADITGKAFEKEPIKEALDTVQKAMDSDVDYIVKNNYKLNIKNLKSRIEAREKEQNQKQYLKNENQKKEAENKSKVLNEARAMLTSSSLFMMQKAGVNITYTEITVMVDISASKQNQLSDALFMLEDHLSTIDDRQLLNDTINVMGGFKSLPIATLGSVYTKEISYTARAIYNEGNLVKAKFNMAVSTYEAVGTEVRADLGDSIAKAFGNIDTLLMDAGVDVNDSSRRAARVLGYNSIEITKEAVVNMENIVSEVDELTRNLTPRAAVYLIKNGINPLDTDIAQLNEKLRAINNEIAVNTSNERYSEYLWKLEKRGDISKEERNAYVQIYRIIENINKQDGRATGAVAKAGQEMTLSNLYSAVKTLRAKNIDKKIDDTFGILESGYSEDDLTAYLNKTTEIMADDSLHGQYRYERMQEKIQQMENERSVSYEELMRIVTGMEGSSINNIYSAMLASDTHFYKMVGGLEDERLSAELTKVSNLWTEDESSIPDEEQVVSSLKNLDVVSREEKYEEDYRKSVLRTDIRRVCSFMAKQADNKSYYIPMDIQGETTMVHMTFKHMLGNENGKISIYTQTAQGKISAFMARKEDSYDTFVATDSIILKEKLDTLVVGTVVLSDNVRDDMWSGRDIFGDENENNGDDVRANYGELVRQAKSFIHNVLNQI